MISPKLTTPQEMLRQVAEKAKTKRLTLNLSQQTLSQRSGVSYGVLKKFERTGQISLESLLKLALTLGSLSDFEQVFFPDNSGYPRSLDEMMQEGKRKRGRK